MFNLGGMEILVILVVALLVLGPDKLPGFMRAAGKALGELRRVTTDLRDTVNTAITDDAASSASPTPKNMPEPSGDTVSSETPLVASPQQQEAAQSETSGHSGPAAVYPHPCSSVPDANTAPVPPRKRSLPRAVRSRRSHPQTASLPNSADNAGDS